MQRSCVRNDEAVRTPVAVQIAGAPRLLVTPLQPDKLAAFRLTTLEKDPKSFLEIFSKQALFTTSELGVPINLLDIERYAVPSMPPELDPEDLALLEVSDPLWQSRLLAALCLQALLILTLASTLCSGDRKRDPAC